MDYIPPNALIHIPVLVREYKSYWPDHPYPSTLASQVEQETCISLKHSKCWSTRAELKTSREYGFGLGQITITSKFNNFDVIKAQNASLKDWSFEDRYNSQKQIIALLTFNKSIYTRIIGASDPTNKLLFSYAAYNGGAGGLNSDRRVCKATPGCDSTKWFGHVEKTSLKQKTATSGYGKSFYEINREYVTNIYYVRRPKYDTFFSN